MPLSCTCKVFGILAVCQTSSTSESPLVGTLTQVTARQQSSVEGARACAHHAMERRARQLAEELLLCDPLVCPAHVRPHKSQVRQSQARQSHARHSQRRQS
eukprot:3923289-Prymnesium_polylepis.2